MQPRLARIAIKGVSASWNGQRGELVNISRGGALVRLKDSPEVDGSGPVSLWVRVTRVTLTARVVRVEQDKDTGQVLVGMEFLEMTPLEVAAILRPLLAVSGTSNPMSSNIARSRERRRIA